MPANYIPVSFSYQRRGGFIWEEKPPSPGYTWGGAVRPGGHGGWRPTVGVGRGSRAGRNGRSSSRRGSGRRSAGQGTCWRSWWSSAVWSWTGSWRSEGNTNHFSSLEQKPISHCILCRRNRNNTASHSILTYLPPEPPRCTCSQESSTGGGMLVLTVVVLISPMMLRASRRA